MQNLSHYTQLSSNSRPTVHRFYCKTNQNVAGVHPTRDRANRARALFPMTDTMMLGALEVAAASVRSCFGGKIWPSGVCGGLNNPTMKKSSHANN